MKHAIYALLALCLVLSGCEIATTETQQDDRLIITVPTSPTTVQKLQVAYEDLGEMNWYDAKKACANLGNGWRLPTLEELQVMYKELHLKGKGGFPGGWCWYWSSTLNDDGEAWNVQFANGNAASFYGDDYENYDLGRVRAVRALK